MEKEMEKQVFDVSGMTCASCQAAVTRAVSKLDGVESADVSLLAQNMRVEYDPKLVNPAEIEKAVADAGYSATLQQAETGSSKPESAAQIWEDRSERIRKETEDKKKKLISSLILLAILLCFSMLPMLGVFSFLMDMEWMMADACIQMFLSTVILFIQRDFFTHGFKTLLHGSPNMDTLVAVGSSVSFIYGFYGLLTMAYGYGTMDHELIHSGMNALYFESAAMIVTLVSLGKYLEARSKSKTGDALAKLVSLAPKTAFVKRGDDFVEIPAEDVRAGDLVRIVPGASIPVDGTVVEGSGTLDQSAITGESMPVEKAIGDEVMSASTNLNGSFVMRATKVGSDTTLSQIISLVDEAGNSKAPIARLADKVSGVFVPVVLGISLVTLIGWLIAGHSIGFALNCAISVLVISCPCALGLATPLAIMVATGKAAQYGILVKSAGALEELAKVNTVVLDKTGTITRGKPAVVSLTLFGDRYDADAFMTIAASAESGSEHPLAKAVLEEAKKENRSLYAASDFKAFGGRGLEVMVNGIFVQAGNQAFMNEEHVALDEKALEAASEIARKGGTPLFFAFDHELCGIIGAADEIRPTSRDAIALLRKEGIDVIMLTGDNAQTAKAVSQGLELSNVISDVLPADKESVIRKLEDEGKIVAMVGDGINDAPALTRADVGFAIQSGTDIAMESADIVLMKNNLLDVVTAVELSRATIRNIKENLFWAFFYNILGIPVAMGLFYPINGWLLNPMIGAASMSFSSVTVCLNALRLRFFKPAKAISQMESPEAEKQQEAIQISKLPAVPSAEMTASALASEVSAASAAQKRAETAQPSEPAHKGLKGTPLVWGDAKSAKAAQAAPAARNAEPAAEQTVRFNVDGMTCAHCQKHVTQALQKIDGVRAAEVTLKPGEALVLADRPIELSAYEEAVKDAGYETRTAIPQMSAFLKDFHPQNEGEITALFDDLKKDYPELTWMVYSAPAQQITLCGDTLPEEGDIFEEIAKLEKSSNEPGEGGEMMTLTIDGMSCQHCVARVEKALQGVEGVESVKVDLASGKAVVTGKDLSAAALAKAVTAAGYSVSAIDD